MLKCKVCNNIISPNEDNLLILSGVPLYTFNCSNETTDLQLLSCKYCGCVQQYNYIITSNYEDVYRSIGVSFEYREKKKSQLENFINKYNLKTSNIIEVGCGDGQILDILREIGITAEGVETNKENFEVCKKKNHKVHLNSVNNILGQYDAFLSIYHLEHLPNPLKYVFNLYRILKPGSVGLIEVPNYDFIEKNNIWLEFTKEHIVYYRKRSITSLLLNCGFSVEEINEESGGLCLSIVVKKPQYDYSFSKMKKEISDSILKFKQLVESLNYDFAIYGAGHYSMFLINLCYIKYGIKPKYIFDSNLLKCGQKIYDIEVEHRDNMNTKNDLKNIIICCGVYNVEVAKILKEMNVNNQWEKIIEWN